MEKHHHSQAQATASEVNVQDDPRARDLLRRAFEKTYRWPKDFTGFEADLILSHQGRAVKGTVRVKLGEDVTVTLPDEDLKQWAQGQIGMMAVHRGPRTFEASDGRHKLTLGEEDNHPLGRLVFIHGDGMNSRYRIREDRIQQIQRTPPHVKFTINVEESLPTKDGRFLTSRYSVYYFSSDGQLRQVENYWDTPAQAGDLYLPGQRRVSFAENGEVVTRTLHFQGHRLL
jgi:Protein of unknown function (DUF3386)